MNPELNIGQTLKDLLFQTNSEKVKASENEGAVVARRWAILHTELEKAYAYYSTFLESKEGEVSRD